LAQHDAKGFKLGNILDLKPDVKPKDDGKDPTWLRLSRISTKKADSPS
jgi:hypothetical protein